MQRIPLIRRADEITAEWMQQALAAGGATDCPHLDTVEVERLSDVTSMLGNLFRCRLIAQGSAAASPASVIVKLPTSNAMAFRLAKWLSLHRREYVFYRDIAARGHLRVPALFYGDFDGRSHRSVLVLEDLDLAGVKSISHIEGRQCGASAPGHSGNRRISRAILGGYGCPVPVRVRRFPHHQGKPHHADTLSADPAPGIRTLR